MADTHGTRAIVAAFLANLAIAAAKLVAFAFTRSSAMLAESIHSLADTGNQALLIFGGRAARRAPTETHPFGYGRERYFWAFIVALVLFSLGSLFALFEGVSKVRDPHEVESPAWAFGVLIVAIVLEAFSLRTAVKSAAEVRGTLSWWGFIRRSRAPELPVVLLEDAAALAGLFLALGAVALATVTGDGRWDGYGTVLIGVLLGVVAAILAVEMRSLLLGEAATPADQDAIVLAIGTTPRVQRLIHLRTQHLGPDDLLVAAKVAFERGLSVEELAAAIDDVEARVRAEVPIARLMYVEPDIYREGGPPADTTA